MPERKQFQYYLATGKMTFPVAVIFCLAMTGLHFQELTDLLPLIAAGTTAYLLIELNTSFALIRTRTTLHASLFLFFYSGSQFLHTYSHEIWIPLLFVAGIYFLFQSYESPYASIPVFHSFLCLGLGSLSFPYLLYLTPLVYLFMTMLRSFNVRCFFAGIIGITLPYWFLLCYCLYMGNVGDVFLPFIQLADPPHIDYSGMSTAEAVTGGALLLLTATSSIQLFNKRYQDKVQTRIMLRITLLMGIAALILAVLIPAHFKAAITILLVVYAIVNGHLLALTYNKFTHILSWTTLGIWISVTLFNVWTDSFNF